MVYNHENYLDAFFKGVLSQQLPYAYEIVIGVDQSDDASLVICKRYREIFPSIITLIEHEVRVGMIQNFITTYNMCTGKYIAICEGDDYWTDDQKLMKQIQVLDNDKNAVLCFTDIKVLDEEEGTFDMNWAKIGKDRYTIEDLIKSYPISFCSVLFRNNIVALNEHSLQGLSMADLPFVLELMTHGYAKYLNVQTAVYRRSAQSSYSKNTIVEQLLKKKTIYEYLLSQPRFTKYKRQLFKVYNYHLYAIATRLDKTDIRRAAFFKKVIRSIDINNVALPVKALVKSIT
ncbi:MAG: glycosyltransferase [Bacteroidota bacterium]|nr:glycosyltransferase [Bacteroidota bacterium]